MTGSKTAPAPGANTEVEESDRAGGLIGSNLTANVKLPDPRVFIVRDTPCPLACSSEPGRCSWSCAPLHVRDNEVTA